MRKSIFILSIINFAVFVLNAEEATPMDKALQPGTTTMITCFVPKGKKPSLSGGEGTSEDIKKADWKKPYHYRLYIPKEYDKDKSRRFPCMFIADPSGNAQMRNMRNRLQNDNWIVVMLVESCNGHPDWAANFIAAHDDVIKRARVCETFKFATGFSGGARCVSEYPHCRKGFRGVILQSAGFFDGKYAEYPAATAVAGTFGTKDFNMYESQEIRRELNRRTPSHVEIFEGDHSWAPTPYFERAMDWMEEVTFITTKRKLSKQDQSGFVWILDQKLRHLKNASSDVDRYILIKEIMAIAKNGKLLSSKDYKDKLMNLKTEFAALKKKPDVLKECKAAIDFEKCQAKIILFDRVMQKKKALYKKVAMSKKDMSTLEKMKIELQKFIKKHAGTRLAEKSQNTLNSLELEYKNVTMRK